MISVFAPDFLSLITTAGGKLLYFFSRIILFWFGRVLPARIQQHLLQYAYPRSKHQLLVLLLPGAPVQWPPDLSRVVWSCRLSSVPVSLLKERTYLLCGIKSRRNIKNGKILSSVVVPVQEPQLVGSETFSRIRNEFEVKLIWKTDKICQFLNQQICNLKIQILFCQKIFP
jgi:hypothetical protein